MRNVECGMDRAGFRPPVCVRSIPHSEFRNRGGLVIDLSGKRAFVTGGGRGIGRATAVMLARAGASVAVGFRSRKADAAQTCEAVRRTGGRAVGIPGDLGDPGAAKRAVDDAVQALGGLDILIVNHGVWPPDDTPLADMSDDQWEGTRRANLDAVIYVCRASVPKLPDGGRVVLVSSTAGQRGEA